MEEVEEKERVCVTGAGGYVASWLVKFLLTRGYMVHETVSDRCDKKNAHLKKLENSSENLQLFKTDLLDYKGLCAAISGCTGVFHVACPVPVPGNFSNHEVEMMEPAVFGTRNVLNACLKEKVKRVVAVSTIGAVVCNPSWPKDRAMNEDCWSDKEFCKSIDGLTLKSDGLESVEDRDRPVVDVRDVAEALLLACEKPEAKGRYICTSYSIRTHALLDNLKSMYPNYNYPKSFIKVEEDIKLSSRKLQNLGWSYRSVEETIADIVRNCEESGRLNKV